VKRPYELVVPAYGRFEQEFVRERGGCRGRVVW
jgi:hypothetical protein